MTDNLVVRPLTKSQKVKKIIENSFAPEVFRVTNDIFRIGYCSKCGKCCQGISINSQISANVREWLNAYGISTNIVKPVYDAPGDEEPSVFVATLGFPLHCKQLEQSEDGLYLCKIYDNRPSICKYYPRSQSPNLTCTYLFVTREDLEAIRAEHDRYWKERGVPREKIKMDISLWNA